MARIGSWLHPKGLRWKLAAGGILYLAVLVYFSASGLMDHYKTTRHGTTVAAAANQSCPLGAPPSATMKPAQLAPRGTQITTIAFGRDLSIQVRDFEFDVVDTSHLLESAQCLRVRVSSFLRDGTTESAQLDRSRIQASATISGQQALVTVTIPRTDAAFGPSGSYTGTFSLIDPRIERVDIPLTITLSYPVWRLPFVVLWLVLPVAVGYLWLLRGSFHGRKNQPLSPKAFEDYVFSRNGILAIAAGTTSAALVFSAIYLRSATWGTDFVDAIGLFGSMFTAFVASSAPVTASGSDQGAGSQDTAAGSQVTPAGSQVTPAGSQVTPAAGE
jgi:hypothetical protein